MKRRTAFDYNNCDIEIAPAEGAVNIVSCCLAESYIGFKFWHSSFAFSRWFFGLIRFMRLLDFEFI